jgi:hypothetical protein
MDREHQALEKVLATDGSIRWIFEPELPAESDPETDMAMLPKGLVP